MRRDEEYAMLDSQIARLTRERDEALSKLESSQRENADLVRMKELLADENVDLKRKLQDANLQVDVLKRIADAASRVVRGCTRKIVANPGGMCTCDDCTHLSVCLGAYFRPEPEVEKAWFAKRDAEKRVSPAPERKVCLVCGVPCACSTTGL